MHHGIRKFHVQRLLLPLPVLSVQLLLLRHAPRRSALSGVAQEPRRILEGDSDVEWVRASDIVKAEALKERAAQQQQQPRLGAEAAEAAGAADSPRVVEHLFEDRIEPGE